MPRSVFSADYQQFLCLLRKQRKKAGLIQTQVAKRLGESQAFVSKCERGERRVDVIELRRYCLAVGVSLKQFISAFERKLAGKPSLRK